jgi:dTDP-L-rhamnose 4-epimerase
MGCDLSILRFQNIYGAGQSLRNSYTGVLALFACLALEARVIPVYEDGAIVRDFVYIDDVISAIVTAIQRRPIDGYRLLDIGFGQPTTLFNVASHLAQLASAPTPNITGEFRDGDVRAASCDLQAARRDLAYEPVWGLERGLKALLAWVGEELQG